MRQAALVPLLLAIGACGTEIWTFGEEAGPPADGAPGTAADLDGARSDARADADRTDGGQVEASGPDSARGGCADDRDCNLTAPYCDLSTSRCVECLTNTNCTSGRACEPTSHQCVPGCLTDAGACPDYQPVCNIRRVCVCTSDQTCVNQRTGQGACDTTTGQCVDCLSDLQCYSRCDTTRNVCVECLSNFDCIRGTCDPMTSSCVNESGDAGTDSR